MFEINVKNSDTLKFEEQLRQYAALVAEADSVREKDKTLIKSMFGNFYHKRMNVGIGYQRAYGAILSGDHFDLIELPDGNYLFVFGDISGHGLPAYTTLIRLRSAISIAIKRAEKKHTPGALFDMDTLVTDIAAMFTDIMDDANSFDFASVNFTYIYRDGHRYLLKFYNRSMLFPIVMRKDVSGVRMYNLNNDIDGWSPRKGNLLCSDVRKLLGEDYSRTPCCEFVVSEGDSVFFFSDGILEAYGMDSNEGEFGEDRLQDFLQHHSDVEPQVLIHELFSSVYTFIGDPSQQKDDMTAVMINFPYTHG